MVHINDKTLSERVSEHLDRLLKNKDYVVAIVSGRNITTLRDFLGVRNELIYAGDHGVEIEHGIDYFLHPNAKAFCSDLPSMITALSKNLAAYEGVEYELKSYSSAVIFKRSKPSEIAKIEAIICQTVQLFPSLKVIASQFVYEICPNIQWHKGYAIEKIAKDFSIQKENIFFIGDEQNDELAFKHLPDALTIRVGSAQTVAKFKISKQNSIEGLLTIL